MKDFILGIRSINQWFYLGLLDIKLRYQRSFIGPWWITISSFIVIFVLSLIWSKVFKLSLDEYLSFLSIGYILWHWFSGAINESTRLFVEFRGIVFQINLPLSVYFLRLCFRNFIIFLHNFIFLIALLFYMDFFTNIQWGFLFIGLILFYLFIFLASSIVSILSVRFKDFEQFIPTLLQLTFFISPILWSPNSIKDSFLFLKYNPIYYLLNIVREPLMGEVNDINSYLIIFSLILFLFLFFLFLYYKARNKIIFWI